MILLRRVRPARPARSTFDIDIAFDLAQALVRQRQECVAPWRPPVEVFETADHLVVRAEIGGLISEETSVRVEGDHLIVQGERRVSRPHGPRVYHEARIRYGAFEVDTYLPFAVDASAAIADYQDGMLTVQLPRAAAEPVGSGVNTGSQTQLARRGGQ